MISFALRGITATSIDLNEQPILCRGYIKKKKKNKNDKKKKDSKTEMLERKTPIPPPLCNLGRDCSLSFLFLEDVSSIFVISRMTRSE